MTSIQQLDHEETAKDKHEGNEIIVCFAVTVVLAAIVAAVVLLYSIRGPRTTGVSTQAVQNDTPKSSACHGPTCIDAEKILVNIIDQNVDPCADFYHFVCGKYKDESGTTISKMTTDMLKEVHNGLGRTQVRQSGQSAAEKAAGLYAACRNQGVSGVDDIEHLKTFMDEMGLSLLKNSTGEALDKIIRLGLQYSIQTVLNLELTDSVIYEQKRLIEISHSTPQINWLILRESLDIRARGAFYYAHVQAFNGAEPNIELIKTINDVETTASATIYAGQGVPEKSVLLKVSFIELYSPNVRGWEQAILYHSGNVYQSSDNVFLDLRALHYINYLYARLGDEDVSVLVAWELLRQLGPLTSPSIAALYVQSSARQLCLNAVIQAMEVPALSVYLFSAVPPGAIDAANAMLKRIHSSVLQEIEGSNWLDDVPKSVALQKVRSMIKHVGYPAHLSTEEAVNTFYEDYPDVQDRFLDPWISALKKNMQWLIRDRDHFNFRLTPVSAYYLLIRNMMIILASIIRPPVFVLNGPDAFNLGGLGHVLGHEMMHAFDVEGSRRDAEGNLRNWWTTRTREFYEDKALCLRRSHQALSMRRATLLNATLDSENMADFIGLSSVLMVFQEHQDNRRFPNLPYDSTQLFFISSCVKWCSLPASRSGPGYAAPRERCNVPLMHLHEFAKAFQCPLTSPMNPPNKCSFW